MNSPLLSFLNKFAVLSSHCPACKRENVRRSVRRNRIERGLSVLLSPWRCKDCDQRWFRLGRGVQ